MSDETIIANINSLKLEDEEKKPFISFIKGARLGQIIALDKEIMTVGRSQECSIWVQDGAISRKHFQFIIKNNQVTLKDLGSTNGTYVNGEKADKIVLKDSDRIQISQDTIMEINYLDESKSFSEKKVYEMGVMDPVTNTYNKRFFLERIQEEFSYAERKKSDLSLIMIDIDFFKKLNDTYGHQAGDTCLKKVAEAVNSVIRKSDILARFGGEEFAVIMRDTSSHNAFQLAERICHKVNQMVVDYKQDKIHLTISLGVSGITSDMKGFHQLIDAADNNLYHSKENGRNQVTGP